MGLANGSVRITGSTSRRLRMFAVTQIAASFVLLGRRQYADQDAALATIRSDRLRHASRSALNLPVMSYGKTPDQIINFYRETVRRINELPGVDHVALGTSTPGVTPAASGPASVHRRGPCEELKKKILARSFAPFRQGSLLRWACRLSRTRLQRQRSPWRRACGDR